MGSTTYDSFLPRDVSRSRNYFGGSSWGEAKSDTIVDFLKIYKGALSATEIKTLCNQRLGDAFIY